MSIPSMWRVVVCGLSMLALGRAEADMVNLVLNKPVTALTDTVSGTPEEVVDGLTETSWWSYQGNVSTLSFVVDLGRVEPFVAVLQQPRQTSTFAVDISVDRNSWRTIHQQALDWPGNVETSFLRLERPRARYFRYTASNAESAYVGIAEFQVFDPDRVFVDDFEGAPVGLR